jgi:hypothetical protein
MKLELVTHLDKVRDTISKVEGIVSAHSYPCDSRTVMIRGLLSTVIQEHRSMLLLIKSGRTAGSSWPLVRDILNGTRYGLWINSRATEEQILRAENEGEFPLSIPEITREIETAYSADPFFEDLKDRWGGRLNKYSLSSLVRLGRWELDATAELHLDDEEIREATTIATLCIVLLAAKFLAAQKYSAGREQIEALAKDYASSTS